MTACAATHPEGYGRCLLTDGHKMANHLVISYCTGPTWEGNSETHTFEHSHSHRWNDSGEMTMTAGEMYCGT